MNPARAFIFIGILMSMVLIFLFSSGCRNASAEPPKAVKGVFDLQSFTGWDLKLDGKLRLEGEWEFYREEFISPCSNPCSSLKGKQNAEYIKVPGYWNDSISGEKEFGSYRLILRNLPLERTGLKLTGVFTSYVLYINGQQVSQAGKVGRSSDEYLYEMKPDLITFPEGVRNLEIVIHVSNFIHSRGGLRDVIHIGEYGELEKFRRRNAEMDFFLFGALLMMSLYHLGLYSLRRTDRSALYFSAVCFLFSVRPLFLGERELTGLLGFSYGIHMLRAEYVLLYLTLPFLNLYMRQIFPSEFRNSVIKYILLYTCAITVFPLFFPPKIFTDLLFLFHLATLATAGASIIFIILAAVRKREGSLIFTFGIIITAGSAVNDILYAKGIIFTGYYISHAVFLFIFSQAYLLSARFSKAFRDSELSRRVAEEQKLLAEERKAEIEKLNRMKDEFLANLSHELKTPLTYIYMYSEMLASPNEQETVIEYARELLGNAKKLNDYLEDLILMTDIESMTEVKLEQMSVRAAVEENISSLKSLAEENRINISFTGTEDDKILCAGHLFIKMLYAVMKNAVMYSREGGSVSLSFRKNSDECMIICKDNGIGIPEKMHKKIFKKFFRVDSSLKYEKSGVGIGLYLASRIAALHKGRIELDSEEGKGSEFRIVVPAGDN